MAPDVAELGIEVKELFLLAEVDEFPHPAALAERFSMPKPTVTVYLKHLEASGLVRREIDAGDLRRHRLLVTPKGRKVIAAGMAVLTKAYGARLESLTATEQTQLASMLARMM